jgi:hypothetical protein
MAAKKAPKRDFAETAFAVFQQAIGEKPQEQLQLPEPSTVIRARKGGLKGGKARAKALTKEQRAEIARVAAEARWKRS